MPSAFSYSIMKKYDITLRLSAISHLPSGWVAITLEQFDGSPMPQMLPGQFVEVGVDRSRVLLNRPISIYNRTENTLELLVAPVGRATKVLASYQVGDSLHIIGPLGHGFTSGFAAGSRVLLVGGGVGIAPLYYQARMLVDAGCDVQVVFGMRTAPDACIIERFSEIAPIHICTDDGSCGFHGLVTQHPRFASDYDYVQVCGPKPMMKAIYKAASERGLAGEVSLENMMACGVGACLCCVEKTVKGNVCVCKEGPVFNFDMLSW